MEKIIKELEQKKVELLKEVETIDKAIKTLSKKDISPAEKWVLETIDGVKPLTNEYGYVEWRCTNGDWRLLFTQDFKYGELYVGYSIWSDLKNDFGLSYNENQELLTKVLHNYTDNGNLKVNFSYTF